MNKSCKEYIKEIKAMFPIKGRAERKYIKKLSNDVEEYCEDAGVISKEDLYENYGTPFNVVESYFTVTGISYVSKKLKISKYIKILISVIIDIALIISSLYAYIIWEEHEMIMREEMVGVETVIE